jgi:hypothetical protein
MFNRRYKFHPLDVYKGQLKNEGETIRLVDGTGTMIDSVVYSDKSPWPVKADGAGYSLAPVYADRLGDPNDAKTWSRSSLKNGTPGKDDPKSIIAIDENVPNMFKMFTVCYVGRFRILIPFKKDFQVTILNLQGRTIADFAQRGKLQYQWTPGCDGLFFIRFRSKNGKQLVKKVLIMN